MPGHLLVCATMPGHPFGCMCYCRVPRVACATLPGHSVACATIRLGVLLFMLLVCAWPRVACAAVPNPDCVCCCAIRLRA